MYQLYSDGNNIGDEMWVNLSREIRNVMCCTVFSGDYNSVIIRWSLCLVINLRSGKIIAEVRENYHLFLSNYEKEFIQDKFLTRPIDKI